MKLLLPLIISLISIQSVFAFGISSPYHKDNPLEMYPGQTKDVMFNLQNCPSLGDYCEKEDVNVVVSFEEGNEIAEIISGLEYNVPYGTADTNIILKVSIPEDGNVGDSYNVKFSIGAAPSGEEGGNVQLGVRYNVDFPVNVAESFVKSPKELSLEDKSWKIILTIIMLVAVFILLIILVIVWRNMQKETIAEFK